jgi:hypothetical protein
MSTWDLSPPALPMRFLDTHLCHSLVGFTCFVSPGSFDSTIDRFAPHAQHVDLRIVGQPDCHKSHPQDSRKEAYMKIQSKFKERSETRKFGANMTVKAHNPQVMSRVSKFEDLAVGTGRGGWGCKISYGNDLNSQSWGPMKITTRML